MKKNNRETDSVETPILVKEQSRPDNICECGHSKFIHRGLLGFGKVGQCTFDCSCEKYNPSPQKMESEQGAQLVVSQTLESPPADANDFLALVDKVETILFENREPFSTKGIKLSMKEALEAVKILINKIGENPIYYNNTLTYSFAHDLKKEITAWLEALK